MTKKRELEPESNANRYEILIRKIFSSHYKPGIREFEFHREEIERFAKSLKVALPKNLGDLIYSFRYRTPLPEAIRNTAPTGSEWVIEAAGRSKYRFVLTPLARLIPNQDLIEIKVPNSTPGIIAKYALTDEQALLAKIRYNRLIDIFTGITCYALQSHLRTTVSGMGQVETDEIYIGLDRRGAHYVFPVQAKRGKDALGSIQIRQDVMMCHEKWPDLICRPVAAQFMAEDLIAMFELEDASNGLRLAAEKHYRLVPPEELSPEDLEAYKKRPD